MIGSWPPVVGNPKMEIQMMYKIITFVKKRNLPLLFRNKNSAFPASYGADIYFPTHIEAVVPKYETVLRVM